VIKDALTALREIPLPYYIYSADMKVLMRSLIVYRFIKKNWHAVQTL
jgi:hypothetical protein